MKHKTITPSHHLPDLICLFVFYHKHNIYEQAVIKKRGLILRLVNATERVFNTWLSSAKSYFAVGNITHLYLGEKQKQFAVVLR